MFFISAFDLIARVKNNLALLKKKGYYSSVDHLLKNEKHQELKFREATPQEKRRFFQKIKNDNEKRIRNERIILVLFILVSVIIFMWLVDFIRN